MVHLATVRTLCKLVKVSVGQKRSPRGYLEGDALAQASGPTGFSTSVGPKGGV
jgi:hypothetical protein